MWRQFRDSCSVAFDFHFALDFRQMTDAQGQVGKTLGGLANTAMIVQVPDKDRVIRTRPGDFESPDKKTLGRLLGVWDGGF